jgi:hypothetical protein
MPKLSLANNGSCVEYDGPAAAERLHTCFAQQRLEETVTALVIFSFPNIWSNNTFDMGFSFCLTT